MNRRNFLTALPVTALAVWAGKKVAAEPQKVTLPTSRTWDPDAEFGERSVGGEIWNVPTGTVSHSWFTVEEALRMHHAIVRASLPQDHVMYIPNP